MWKSLALAALMGASSTLAQTCSAYQQCPEATPCCSQFGECGVGAYCLGGCDPKRSFSLDSCLPVPVCEDKELDFRNLRRVADIGSYLGDPEDYDWVASGEPVVDNGNLLLTMPRGSVGTLLSSTTYLWYGNVKARMKTSRGRGVITAFILFSGVQDEIDYEWVGVDLETAQTNYYFQGNPNYENSENLTVSDSFNNFHDYEIRWTPDRIEWWIDGRRGRVKERRETWNSTGNHWEYPQTPARLQLSLWPGGLESNPEGTVDWAGGYIDWNHRDIQEAGFFYAEIESVTIECYNGRDGLGTNSRTSYLYDDQAGTNDTVVDSDEETTIASLRATGLDRDRGRPREDDDDEDNEDDDEDDEDVRTVPGAGSGSPANDHSGDGGSGGGGGGGGSGGSSGSSDPTDDYDWRDFTQGLDDNENEGGNSGDDGGSGGVKSQASALAMVVAGCALYWL